VKKHIVQANFVKVLLFQRQIKH